MLQKNHNKGPAPLKEKGPADKERLNEVARSLYLQEISGLVAALNKEIPEGRPKLFIPDDKFRRGIGEHAGKPFSVKGELLSPEAYERHLSEVLPGPADDAILEPIFKEKAYIVPVEQGAAS